MKGFIITLMGIFIIVGEYTVINGILGLLHLQGNLYIAYIIYIAMLIFNWYMLKTYDEETIENYKKKESTK